MKVTKIGHCCLIVKEGDVKILTDPGSFTVEGQEKEVGVQAVLITHEHGDHFHVDSLKNILKNNPGVRVITNSGVGNILDVEGITHEVVEGADSTDVNGVAILAHDGKHEEIFKEIGQVQNTGYFIGGRLFYPGDSFSNPGTPVDILALPVAGPWCEVSDFMRYALEIKPRHAFPVHDGQIMPGRYASQHSVPEKILPEHGISFVALKNGESHEW